MARRSTSPAPLVANLYAASCECAHTPDNPCAVLQLSFAPFVDYIKANHDFTQMEAIEMCATLCVSPAQTKTFLSTCSVGTKPSILPFVLIQGPPGTGKTHTVKVIPTSEQCCLDVHPFEIRRHQPNAASNCGRTRKPIDPWTGSAGGIHAQSQKHCGCRRMPVVPCSHLCVLSWHPHTAPPLSCSNMKHRTCMASCQLRQRESTK